MPVAAVGDAQSPLAPLAAAPAEQWSLPSRLAEISALALTADERLLAVDDERGIIYQLDFVDGSLVKAFALGKPVLRKDFEGLTVVGDFVFLLTSDGTLYQTVEGADGERVSYRKLKTKLDDECEFEGLAHDRSGERLLLLCKKLKKKADIEMLSIFPWIIESEEIDFDGRIELPIRDISMRLRVRHLHPSGLAVSPDDGSLIVVAAREFAVIHLDADGTLRDAILLPQEQRHPQAEGIEISERGELIIADEGRNGRARLTVYRPHAETDKNKQ